MKIMTFFLREWFFGPAGMTPAAIGLSYRPTRWKTLTKDRTGDLRSGRAGMIQNITGAFYLKPRALINFSKRKFKADSLYDQRCIGFVQVLEFP